MDDERLRQRIVVAVDSLPVPRGPAFSPAPRSRRNFLGYRSLPVSVAAAVLVAGLVIAVPMLSGGQPASESKPTPPAPLSKPTASASPSTLTSFTDTFSIGIDRTRWNVVIQGRGPLATSRNGRVELNIPADATGAGQPIGASLELERCAATGDYVAVVEYEVLEWPPLHGVEVRFGELPPNAALITRDQYADVDSIHGRSTIRDYRQRIADPTGSLRLARTNGNVVISFRAGQGPWEELPDVRWPSVGEARFTVSVSSDAAQFTGQTVRVAVDNFQLSASEIVCK